MKFTTGFAAVLCAVLSTAAFAQHQVPAACQSDAASLCPGMSPGDHKFGKCMKAHEAQVSSGCKSAARELRKERKAQKGTAGQANTAPMPSTPATSR